MTFEITTERIEKFRAKLREEMLGNQIWYHPTKEKNRDVFVIRPECPYASKNGKVAEHRYIWWLNNPHDPIEWNEMIHHVNGDHQDNRIENLAKMKMKQHGIAHKKLKDAKP